MAVRYRYFGVFRNGDSPTSPSSLFRAYTGPDGQEHEEVFTRDLVWDRSYWLSPMARSDSYDDDYFPVDEAVARRFIERVRDLHGNGEPLEALLEARPVVPVRDRVVTPDEALALIRNARRPADAAFRDYIFGDDDPLYAAYTAADDDGQRHLRDAAERLLLAHSDACPPGAVDVLGRFWGTGFREPDRIDRLVRHYVEHGPLSQLGRVLWGQSTWVTAAQVRALEGVAARDPMRHLQVCSVVLEQDHHATGAAWAALAEILRGSTDPETLARLHDVIEQSTGGAGYNEIIRSRNLPHALLRAIGERTRDGVARFLPGVG